MDVRKDGQLCEGRLLMQLHPFEYVLVHNSYRVQRVAAHPRVASEQALTLIAWPLARCPSFLLLCDTEPGVAWALRAARHQEMCGWQALLQ